jgi:hypothetical protein
MARYAVIRTIDILDGYRTAQPPPEDQRNAVRWQIVEEPRFLLEHAADLFRRTCAAAQESPLETVTNVESNSYLWNELCDYARPALRSIRTRSRCRVEQVAPVRDRVRSSRGIRRLQDVLGASRDEP